MEIIDNSTATIAKYTKKNTNGIINYSLPTTSNISTINRNLVFKVGIKLTKKGTLRTTLVKQLSSYNL